MKTINSVAHLSNAIRSDKAAGKRVALVPTMGNLHDGHIELVRRAQQIADVVVVSIFVNPLQFGPNEDLDAYPRTLSADKAKLFAEGTQYLFTPQVEEMYPLGLEAQTQVSVPNLTDTLCGKSRPGHFDGVSTVVTKLFNMVQPDVAVFGKKDFQQLAVIRKMVADLCLPIEIVGVDTVRADDGLALSSRNNFLNRRQRQIAPRLREIIRETRDAIASGYDGYRELELRAQLDLTIAGFEPDYFEILDAATLRDVTPATEEIAIVAAAKLGDARLLDNITLILNPQADWGMLAAV